MQWRARGGTGDILSPDRGTNELARRHRDRGHPPALTYRGHPRQNFNSSGYCDPFSINSRDRVVVTPVTSRRGGRKEGRKGRREEGEREGERGKEGRKKGEKGEKGRRFQVHNPSIPAQFLIAVRTRRVRGPNSKPFVRYRRLYYMKSYQPAQQGPPLERTQTRAHYDDVGLCCEGRGRGAPTHLQLEPLD